MNIRYAFYRAGKDGHWVDNAISIYTGLFNPGTGPYSHVETWWPGNNGNFKKGECFTSTMRGDLNGTVIRRASEVFTHPERWDVCEIEVANKLVYAAGAKAIWAAQKNKGYDKPALSSFFLPWRSGSKDKDICSEVCKRFAMWCHIVDNDHIESPRRFSRTLTRLGYQIYPLTEVI